MLSLIMEDVYGFFILIGIIVILSGISMFFRIRETKDDAKRKKIFVSHFWITIIMIVIGLVFIIRGNSMTGWDGLG